MRRIRYAVAASLDGYIAGPQGELTGQKVYKKTGIVSLEYAVLPGTCASARGRAPATLPAP